MATDTEYFIRTTKDAAEKGPFTLNQLKDSVAKDRIQETTLARERDSEEMTTVGKLLAAHSLDEERDERRKEKNAAADANRPAAWRIVPLVLLIVVGVYQSYDAYGDWKFMSAASSLGLSGGGGPSPMRLVLWLGVTGLAVIGLLRILNARKKPD